MIDFIWRPGTEGPVELPARDVRRFWSHIDVTTDKNACWMWRLSTSRGYGQFHAVLEGRRCMLKAHRVAWMLSFPDRPIGNFCVCHTCDDPGCCNPKHLWLGTSSENTADKVAKGRQSRGHEHQARVRAHVLRGTQLSHAKLSPKMVRQIRSRASSGVSFDVLARDYDVTNTAIRKVVTRRSWRHVTDQPPSRDGETRKMIP